MVLGMTDTTDKPMRKDAVRNRARILSAAGELFAQRGLAVTLNDIAHHAGVGVGTVYRHFPEKAELIETLFHERVDEMVAIGEAALADPDPWNGLVTVLRRTLELQAADRGLHELANDNPAGMERHVHVRSRMLPIGRELVRRAQAAGSLRADVLDTDLAIWQLMVGAVLDASRDVSPDLWRRFLEMVLRGLSTHPDELGPLPSPALEPEQLDQVMSAHKFSRR
jgi:AcrR family transcriptional regulator